MWMVVREVCKCEDKNLLYVGLIDCLILNIWLLSCCLIIIIIIFVVFEINIDILFNLFLLCMICVLMFLFLNKIKKVGKRIFYISIYE